eukprot:gene31836-38495_t
MPDEDLKDLEAYQKTNHFPNSWCVGRKDRLSRLLSQFKRNNNSHNNNNPNNKVFAFHPETYIFPADFEVFKRLYNNGKDELWIVKPVASSCGRGIHVTSTIPLIQKHSRSAKQTKLSQTQVQTHISDKKKLLIQRYVKHPYLIDGHKFDLRIYVLVAGVDPLRIYIHEEGLTRISTGKYTTHNLKDRFIHLTNYSVNKKNPKFNVNMDNNKEPVERDGKQAIGKDGEKEVDVEGQGDEIDVDSEDDDDEKDSFKWTLSQFKTYITQKEGEAACQGIFTHIHNIVIQTFIAAEKELTTHTHSHTRYRNTCFELFGCDILLDRDAHATNNANIQRVQLLEVNVSPSLMCPHALDRGVKERVICDTLHTVGVYAKGQSGKKAPGGGNAQGFVNWKEVLNTQDEFRRNPSTLSIDLHALSLIDNNHPTQSAPTTSQAHAAQQQPAYCPWWMCMLMLEDERERALSGGYLPLFPPLTSHPSQTNTHSNRQQAAHSPIPPPLPHSAEFYLSLFAAPRFSDHLHVLWVGALGGWRGAAGAYLPAHVQKELHIHSKPRQGVHSSHMSRPRSGNYNSHKSSAGTAAAHTPNASPRKTAANRPRSASGMYFASRAVRTPSAEVGVEKDEQLDQVEVEEEDECLVNRMAEVSVESEAQSSQPRTGTSAREGDGEVASPSVRGGRVRFLQYLQHQHQLQMQRGSGGVLNVQGVGR